MGSFFLSLSLILDTFMFTFIVSFLQVTTAVFLWRNFTTFQGLFILRTRVAIKRAFVIGCLFSEFALHYSWLAQFIFLAWFSGASCLTTFLATLPIGCLVSRALSRGMLRYVGEREKVSQMPWVDFWPQFLTVYSLNFT